MSTNADLDVRLAEVNLYITCMYYNLLYMYNAAYPHTRYITLTTSVRCHNPLIVIKIVVLEFC